MIAVVGASELTVFMGLFLVVIGIGLYSKRWRSGDMESIDEWGLGGRRFGGFVTWFLQGGSIYTTYSFVAIPALVFGAGALGFYALPYLVIAYIFGYLILPPLWDHAKSKGHVTVADMVKDNMGSRLPAVLVALTGIIATMPYVALQVYGIQVSIAQLGIPVDVSLWSAFIILAVITYLSGLRAAALIAMAKDVLIWTTVIVALIYIPMKLGGYSHIFAQIPKKRLMLPNSEWLGYSTLALGSGLALFVYPHSTTGTLSASSRRAVEHNSVYLPIYTLMLGMLAMLGYMAMVAGVHKSGQFANNIAVPGLFQKIFPGPFAGFALAAIAIGALVPASVMAIAAANLFTRNVYKELFPRPISASVETHISKVASLCVKFGGVAFIVFASSKYVVNFQLAGGVWITQILPMVVLPLFVSWIDMRSAVGGWALGMGWGTYILVSDQFNSSLHHLSLFGHVYEIYTAVPALILNLVVTLGGSGVVAVARKTKRGSPVPA
ncbi:MAG TPA: sodium:solute symporter [Acidimicrobiales bacterium]|nr:sodium:solute symporter [Acidimicrobiales bacterium]